MCTSRFQTVREKIRVAKKFPSLDSKIDVALPIEAMYLYNLFYLIRDIILIIATSSVPLTKYTSKKDTSRF